MTMKEKLKIHKQIEAENREHLEDFLARRYWDSLSVTELQSMIQEKDERMEWDEHFNFLRELLERKERKEKTA